MAEPDFIAALKALVNDPAARNLDDDAAVLEVGGETLILTHDTLVQGVHVREDENPADIAWKLIAVNLSDLAAKGAKPLGVLVSHMLGDGDARFVEGLGEILQEYDVPLLGGDTVSAEGRRVWGCTAIGRATHTPVPDRRAAQPGDGVYVTGSLGRAMLGFEEDRRFDKAYRRPEPRLREGELLAPLVSAMMDISDGLLLDSLRMAEASGVGIELESGSIPVADPSRRDDCIRWGDDYELLFTLPEGVADPVPATRIGSVNPRTDASLFLDGEPLGRADKLGYSH
ncbi:thiamine-phosphate kinase [Erythrobacter litoralis]|uniref:thiamine-phosphate kinase n=1 Tax=Erythrobacter litoralis TaxID=39960 RepID=UPI002435BCBC|nr:thiamine-phosphate kinase [Erythrobacter litoralis]MDG6078705.1 thiamine-phosphate kinase [Erythrobacter litoralis]